MNVGSTKNALQFLTSIIVVVFALKIIAWECYNNGQKKLLCKLNKYASYVFGSLIKYVVGTYIFLKVGTYPLIFIGHLHIVFSGLKKISLMMKSPNHLLCYFFYIFQNGYIIY